MSAVTALACTLGVAAAAWSGMPRPRHSPVVSPEAPRWLKASEVRLDSVTGTEPHPFLDGQSVAASLSIRVEASFPEAPRRVSCMLDGGLAMADATCASPPADTGRTICHCGWGERGVTAGMHSVAVYASDASGSIGLVGGSAALVSVLPSTDPATVSARARLARAAPDVRPRVGVYYTTINSGGMSLWQNMTALREDGSDAPTVEDGIAAGTPFQELVAPLKRTVESPYFPVNGTDWPQSTPAVGNASLSPFYCFYAPRPGEDPIMPACPDIPYHARRQSSLMRAAGIDYVLQDASNYGPWDPSLPHGGDVVGDVRQLRPFEVLVDEWRSLRDAGEATPSVGVFNRVSSSSRDAMWRVYLDRFYENATFSDMVFRARANGTGERMPVFMLVARHDVNETAVRAIEASGNGTLVPRMWLSLSPNGSDTAAGLWTYFAPCTGAPADPGRDGAVVFSSTVWPGGPPCRHAKTTGSVIGSAWTISMAQVFGNLPFQDPGKLRGAFFKLQAADAFADPEGTDFWFSPSWNENSITPVPMSRWKMTNPFFAGAATREGDWYRSTMWMDGFGAHRSRTIEPMRQDGGLYYGVYASCVRVARLASAWGVPLSHAAAPCAVAGEECCQLSAEEMVRPVWSVRHPTTGDSALVATRAELEAFVGRGYAEICNPFGSAGPNGEATAFCVDGSLPWCDVEVNGTARCFDAVRGPVMLMAGAADGFRTRVVRCEAASSGRHYPASRCRDGDGDGVLLGFAWDAPTSAAPRRLYRCDDGAGGGFHVLDSECLGGARRTFVGQVI